METIVVGVDGSEASADVLRWTLGHAAANDLIRAVYVWSGGVVRTRRPIADDE